MLAPPSAMGAAGRHRNCRRRRRAQFGAILTGTVDAAPDHHQRRCQRRSLRGGQRRLRQRWTTGRRPRCRIRQGGSGMPQGAGRRQVRRWSPFPATRSARGCPRCSSVPAAHGHGPAGSVLWPHRRRVSHREPDIAASGKRRSTHTDQARSSATAHWRRTALRWLNGPTDF